MKTLCILVLVACAWSALVRPAAAQTTVYLWNITYEGAWTDSDTWVIVKQHSPTSGPYSLVRIQVSNKKFLFTENNHTIIDQPLPAEFAPWRGFDAPPCNGTVMVPGSVNDGSWFSLPFSINNFLHLIWIKIRCDLRVELWSDFETDFSSYPYGANSGFLGGGFGYIAYTP